MNRLNEINSSDKMKVWIITVIHTKNR